VKIGYYGIELPEGKVKYIDTKVETLTAKHQPKKVSPFYVEFIKGEFDDADVIVTSPDDLINLLIQDMTKCETRLERCEDNFEAKLMAKCIEHLETESPLCELYFTDEEHKLLNRLPLLTKKPVIIADQVPENNHLIEKALSKANIIFFYTAGPQEVHAWPTPKGTDILTCAGKIHSDLARGFIKGDVVSYPDYVKHHNFNECKNKGVAQVVDKDYIIEDGNIIEIRFNV